MFLVDQEFKQLRLIKDGSDISFLVEGIRNSADILFKDFLWKKSKQTLSNFSVKSKENSGVPVPLPDFSSESVKPVIEMAFSKKL